MLLTLVTTLLIAGAASYWVVAHRAKGGARAPREIKAVGRFGAVEIRTRSGACDAAHALEGQRFLAKNAPSLPLPSCAAAQCTCSFGKLSDRRTEGRRLGHGGLSASLFLTNNRRQKRDRRHTTKPRA